MLANQPIKRSGDKDPFLIANDATPQCFDVMTPFWVLPSIVLNHSFPGGTLGAGYRYMRLVMTIAIYADPSVEGTQMIWAIKNHIDRVVHGSMIDLADGVGAHIRVPQDFTSPLPEPSFPDAGQVMLMRVHAISVWRRP